MTTAQLAERVGVSFGAMAELLRESADMGVVMPTPSGWKLTPDAAERFGGALRSFSLPADDRTLAARHAGNRDVRDRAA